MDELSEYPRGGAHRWSDSLEKVSGLSRLLLSALLLSRYPFRPGHLPGLRGPALGRSPANLDPRTFWVPLGPSKGTTITGLGPCPTKVTTLSKPAGRGPWRWNAASEAGGLGVGNAGTFAHLGGEGGGLLLKGAKVGKTPFASLAGWAKDGTVALVSTSKTW